MNNKQFLKASLAFVLAFAIITTTAAKEPTKAALADIQQKAFAKFWENKGQITNPDNQAQPQVKYAYQQGGTKVFLLPTGLSYQFEQRHYPDGYKQKTSLPKEAALMREMQKDIRTERYRMDINLVGANPNARISTGKKSQDYINYYNADVINVYGFEEITYHDIYPNIDWVLRTTEKGLKYDFVVRVGGNPAQIRLQFDHQEGLKLNADGSLTISNRMGTINEQAPVSFQGDKTVASRFVLTANILQFDIAAYDHSKTLVIDPEVLWATYYGGSNQDYIHSTAIDSFSNIYIAGKTLSANIFGMPGYQQIYGGLNDAFLTKFDSDGHRLWSTYYGGDGDDIANAVAANESGSVIAIAGLTSSQNRIAVDAYQNNLYCTVSGNTTTCTSDGFIARFNASGWRESSTYYGHAGHDEFISLAVTNHRIYALGFTTSSSNISSSSLPANGYRGDGDIFMVSFHLNINGTFFGSREYAYYYGGADEDVPQTLFFDKNNNQLYITGYTFSTSNIATAGAHQTTSAGQIDAVLYKLNLSGGNVWSTYFGGANHDVGTSIALDTMGNIYLSGYTWSSNNIASSANVHQSTIGDTINPDAFLAKFNPNGSRVWSTYYGGANREDISTCHVTDDNNVYLIGDTNSPDGIAYNGFQNSLAGKYDFYIARFDTTGQRLWATYYGSDSSDYGQIGTAVINKKNSDMYIAGITFSPANLATNNSFQPNYVDGGDAFLAKIGNCALNNRVTVVGQTLRAENANANYQWVNCANNMPIVGATSASFTATTTGNYAVSVSYGNCGSLSACEAVTIIVATDELLATENYRIYPNPATDLFKVEIFVPYRKLEYILYNAVGQQVDSQVFTTGQLIDLSLPAVSGLYFVSLRADDAATATITKIIRE